MKKPEYAAGVTAVYRKYIDKYYEKPGGKAFHFRGRPSSVILPLYSQRTAERLLS